VAAVASPEIVRRRAGRVLLLNAAGLPRLVRELA
jgi:hypothetical protein